MVGVPFILMTIGIVEMALMFTAQSNLQQAAFEASRLIRTGQLQTGGGDQEQVFRDAVCDMMILAPCADIQMQVEAIPSFADADDLEPEYDADGNLEDSPFDAGEPDSVVLVRLVYNYPIRTPLMAPAFTNKGDSSRRLVSTVVLQNEPYVVED